MLPLSLLLRGHTRAPRWSLFLNPEIDPLTGKPYPDAEMRERRRIAEAQFDVLRQRAKEARDGGDLTSAVAYLRESYMMEDVHVGPRSSSLGDLVRLSHDFAPALDVLHEMQLLGEQRVRRSPDDFDILSEYIHLCRYLWDTEAIFRMREFFEGDRGNRLFLANTLFPLLLEEKRYHEAAALHPFEDIIARLDNWCSQIDKPECLYLVALLFLPEIEALAGAGRMTQAEQLAARLRQINPTEEFAVKLEAALAAVAAE